jgi:hypothetical protein
MRKYLIVVFALLILACSRVIDVEYVKSKTWSFQGGYKVGNGDFMIFDETTTYELKNDTIFYSGAPKARVIQLDKAKLTLKVKSLKDEQAGVYKDMDGSFE